MTILTYHEAIKACYCLPGYERTGLNADQVHGRITNKLSFWGNLRSLHLQPVLSHI